MLLTIHDYIAGNLRNGATPVLWWFWDGVLRLIEVLFPSIMTTMVMRMEMDRQFHPERWERK